MNKKEITEELQKQYQNFIGYINSLNIAAYERSCKGKWTAAQQLEHIVLCIRPLVYVYGMDKAAIEKNFGREARPGHDYETLVKIYKERLAAGGKAPAQYLPATAGSKGQLVQELLLLIARLVEVVNTFEELELDELLIPHPLLGKITLREMLYNAIYHVQHHQKQTEENLRNA